MSDKPTDLRELLREWIDCPCVDDECDLVKRTKNALAQPPDAEPEPVGWMWLEDGIEEYGAPYELRPGSAVPLYAAPQSPAGKSEDHGLLSWALNEMRKMHQCEADPKDVEACISALKARIDGWDSPYSNESRFSMAVREIYELLAINTADSINAAYERAKAETESAAPATHDPDEGWRWIGCDCPVFHQVGCSAFAEPPAPPQPPTGSGHESLAGTFDCPVCGKDFPHNHKVDKVGRVIETNDPDTGVNYVWMLRKKRFEDAVKRCTVYSLSPGRGGDDPLYEDKCTNAAHWGYEAAVSIELADAIPREIHERLVRDAKREALRDLLPQIADVQAAEVIRRMASEHERGG